MKRIRDACFPKENVITILPSECLVLIAHALMTLLPEDPGFAGVLAPCIYIYALKFTCKVFYQIAHKYICSYYPNPNHNWTWANLYRPMPSRKTYRVDTYTSHHGTHYGKKVLVQCNICFFQFENLNSKFKWKNDGDVKIMHDNYHRAFENEYFSEENRFIRSPVLGWFLKMYLDTREGYKYENLHDASFNNWWKVAQLNPTPTGFLSCLHKYPLNVCMEHPIGLAVDVPEKFLSNLHIFNWALTNTSDQERVDDFYDGRNTMELLHAIIKSDNVVAFQRLVGHVGPPPSFGFDLVEIGTQSKIFHPNDHVDIYTTIAWDNKFVAKLIKAEAIKCLRVAKERGFLDSPCCPFTPDDIVLLRFWQNCWVRMPKQMELLKKEGILKGICKG